MVALKAKHLAIIVTGMFAVLIGLAMAFGRWNAEGGRRFADLVGGRTPGVGMGSGAGRGAGRGAEPGRAPEAGEVPEHDASDRLVRGTTTFGDLAAWGVPAVELQKVLGGAAGAAALTVREWAMQRGIGFGQVKGRIQALVDAAAPDLSP